MVRNYNLTLRSTDILPSEQLAKLALNVTFSKTQRNVTNLSLLSSRSCLIRKRFLIVWIVSLGQLPWAAGDWRHHVPEQHFSPGRGDAVESGNLPPGAQVCPAETHHILWKLTCLLTAFHCSGPHRDAWVMSSYTDSSEMQVSWWFEIHKILEKHVEHFFIFGIS